MMKQFINLLTLVVLAMLAVLPIFSLGNSVRFAWLDGHRVAALNFIGWGMVILLLFSREDLRETALRVARRLGIDGRFLSLEMLLSRLFAEIDRKNNSFLVNVVQGQIITKDELSQSLQRIVAHAYQIFNAASAELALFDKESGLYHSSFVLGKPFRSGAQAMLSDALEAKEMVNSPDVMVVPIAFAGSVLGTLRVGLQKGSVPTTGDREIMELLAIQGAIAIINTQYTGELMRMKSTAEESVKAKTGFLANLSHELRGPLGIILNAVELVLDGLCGPVTEDQYTTLRMVKDNGAHLLELINDVLDYAKIEAGKVTVERVEIVVSDLLNDLAGVVRGQAEAKKHTLTIRPSDEVMAICCDRRHARQMFINLLTNAIKYTPNGGTIEVWADRIPGNKVRINVRDSGVGIDKADHEKVFAAFERVENAYSIQQMGTGLGMPLTRRLAEMNGGSVDFDSSPGRGTHFWLIFPAVHFDPMQQITPSSETPEARGNGERILVVEREEGERAMLSRYLSHIGYRVSTAGSRTEAADVLRGHEIDLALIDNNVLDVSGEDVIRALRECAKTPNLPVLLLSSRAFVFDIEKYLRAGIDRCVAKPIAMKELGIICREVICNVTLAKPHTETRNSPTAEKVVRPQPPRRDLVH